MFLGFLSFPRIKRREREKRQEKNMGPKKSSKQREKGKSSGGSKKGMMGGDDDGEELPQDLSVTPEQLHAQVAALQAEKAKEAKDRNRMQIERDKVSTFWEIKKKEVEIIHAKLRNKDRELEELEERHQVEIKVYNQKMKHLLYEQQNIIATIKTDHELALKLQHGQFAKHETELLNDQRALKEKMKELEVGYEDTIRQIKLDHAKEITKMRQEFDGNAKDMQQKTDKKIKTLRDDAELRRKQEIHEIEERKNTHINELMKKHEKAFTEIKCYYNDITQNNLDLIKTLKEDVTDMKKKEAANEKLMYEIAQENKRLTEPLARALKEVENLRMMLAHYEKDKLSLQQSRLQYSEVLNKFKDLEWKYRLLEESFEKVKEEKDNIATSFHNNIFNVQQKCGLKSLLLQQKVQVLDEEVEKKEAQLGEIFNAAKLDLNELGSAKDRVNKVLESKNREIRVLYYENGKIRSVCDIYSSHFLEHKFLPF
ncbi:hypothetical protein O6H91_08G119900 [Diphasiastrum complanatum]|uniref:Uncharacterized protein n=1 Tax=Diphasiastrum complanatum TaxID=34168 RepID=A0ACC2D1P8_DIPCM|nr:hypothetical protein O6H91_08G119900 [Diphasiastrum complanatum]